MTLIDNWKETLKKSWSIRLAGAVALLASLLTANYGLVIGLISFIPGGVLRYVIAGAVGVVVFVIPTVTRLICQPDLAEPKRGVDG